MGGVIQRNAGIADVLRLEFIVQAHYFLFGLIVVFGEKLNRQERIRIAHDEAVHEALGFQVLLGEFDDHPVDDLYRRHVVGQNGRTRGECLFDAVEMHHQDAERPGLVTDANLGFGDHGQRSLGAHHELGEVEGL